jgi:hypothetical protein
LWPSGFEILFPKLLRNFSHAQFILCDTISGVAGDFLKLGRYHSKEIEAEAILRKPKGKFDVEGGFLAGKHIMINIQGGFLVGKHVIILSHCVAFRPPAWKSFSATMSVRGQRLSWK